MQMPRRAMQKQGSTRSRVAIDGPTGGFRSQLAISRSSRRRSTDPDKRSNVRLRNYRAIEIGTATNGRRDLSVDQLRATPGMDRHRSRRREAERSFPQIKTRSQMQNINK